MNFKELEKHYSIEWEESGELSSLDEWYKSVRCKRVDEFSDRDLGIAIRQELFQYEVISQAFSRLLEEPTAGFKYDGEIVVALSHINSIELFGNPLREKLIEVLIQENVQSEFVDEGLKEELDLLISKIKEQK